MVRLSVCLAALVAAISPAAAFDCGKAATQVEKAICADPDLKAKDDEMSSLYADVRRLSTEAERKMLARSQKKWIAEREANCPQSGVGVAQCIRSMTNERIVLFAGKPSGGPGVEGRIIPVFIVQEGTEQVYDLDITMLKFAKASSPGQQRFNMIAEDMVARIKTGRHGEETMGRIWAMEEAMTLNYLSPRLASVMFSSWYDLGGAHGNGASSNFNFSMETGRDYTIGDFFSEESAAKLMAGCKAQIIAEKKERFGSEPYDPEVDSFLKDDTIAEHVATMSSWSFSDTAASIVFNAYAIGSYAEGPYDCTFPLSELKAVALKGAPLP
jgi:uncharacterized protein